jgi:hypothetical protein
LLFEDCFPPSLEEFNESFKERVCSSICKLLWGISPSSKSLPCVKWPKETEPLKRSKAEDQKILKRKLLVQLLTSANAIDIPIVLHEKSDDKDLRMIFETEPDSTFLGTVRKANHVDFNLYQNTPLVSKYLQIDSKKMSIRRNEAPRETIPENARTYRQIIQESLKSSSERGTAYRQKNKTISDQSKNMQRPF